MKKRWLMISFVLAGILALFVITPFALAGNAACDLRANNTFEKLLECVTLGGGRAHQAAFQAIADANSGIRASGTPGYNASVDYVVAEMTAAGYNVTVQPFDFFTSTRLGPSVLSQLTPVPTVYFELTDFFIMDQSDPGDVTAAVTAVDLQFGLGNTSTSGCEAADFAGFPAGNIALLQRGSCSFEQKAENAAAAGAVGAIIFNQGNTTDPARQALFNGTLGQTYTGGIPVASISYSLGAQLASAPGLTMRLYANVFRGQATTYNVFAETAGGDPNNVIIVGAHLDSVDVGPGIQDNGSGSAALLEVAQQISKVKPRNMVRFAWWGAEESGLVGSDYYVYNLAQVDRDKIALYLNFDMIGSPNYVRYIYDGSGDAFGLQGPPGSEVIEKLFENFYTARGLAFEPTQISFRSDYAAFFDFGIPFGGLFTGAEGVKTPAQAAIFGGTAGVAYDPCYHQPCDTYDNISLEVYDLNLDAAAHATLQYAMNTSDINGVKGKGNFKGVPPGQVEFHGNFYIR